ncbi:MAG: cyanophycinase [Planctomycetes bacterium]|nr:cyanophycinase [Planctomycetota bacterium]
MRRASLLLLLVLALPAWAQDKAPPLVRYRVGNAADAKRSPKGPALILMGGGADVDAAFRWWRPYISGGDVVVLRTSGSDGYNDYLLNTIGGCDSVETLLVTSRALANDPRVAKSLAGAEAIFLAGGDQATYLRYWRGTAVSKALAAAWSRRAVIGGTSAGLAVLGEFVFSASKGTVRSPLALADPYGPRVQLAPKLIPIPLLKGVITDTHFGKRQRLGRLGVFLARLKADRTCAAPLGIGVDERTALVVGPDGRGAVLGRGAVTIVRLRRLGTCQAKRPLSGARFEVAKLRAGHTILLPSGAHSLPTQAYRVRAGKLTPVRD